MTRTGTVVLAMIGGFIALLLVSFAFVKMDGNGVPAGVGIGAALGLVNLAVGGLITRRSLRHGMRSALTTLLGGFGARAFLLVALFLIFQHTKAVDPAAFALTFIVFFFVYLGVELLMVERHRSRTPA